MFHEVAHEQPDLEYPGLISQLKMVFSGFLCSLTFHSKDYT